MRRLLHLQLGATFGGDETNSLILCRYLVDWQHHVAIYFQGGPMEQAWQDAGATVEQLGLSSRHRSGFIPRLAELVAKVRPDAIFVSSVVLLPIVLKGLEQCTGPILVHTGNPFGSSLWTCLKVRLAALWWRSHRLPVMVHCSEYVARSYERSAYFARFPQEVAVSAGEMDFTRRHNPRGLAREDEVRLGMVARLDRIKNHRLVLQAFPAIRAAYPRARLEFVGRGETQTALEAETKALGLADAVVFHGRVASPFPIAINWDLFLYATTPAEGFGAALAEAMTLGLPCVVADVGPMREVGGDQGAVRYTADDPSSFAAAATELLASLAIRRALGLAAQARAREVFGGELFAEKIVRIIHRYGGRA